MPPTVLLAGAPRGVHEASMRLVCSAVVPGSLRGSSDHGSLVWPNCIKCRPLSVLSDCSRGWYFQTFGQIKEQCSRQWQHVRWQAVLSGAQFHLPHCWSHVHAVMYWEGVGSRIYSKQGTRVASMARQRQRHNGVKGGAAAVGTSGSGSSGGSYRQQPRAPMPVESCRLPCSAPGLLMSPGDSAHLVAWLMGSWAAPPPPRFCVRAARQERGRWARGWWCWKCGQHMPLARCWRMHGTSSSCAARRGWCCCCCCRLRCLLLPLLPPAGELGVATACSTLLHCRTLHAAAQGSAWRCGTAPRRDMPCGTRACVPAATAPLLQPAVGFLLLWSGTTVWGCTPSNA
jgi:hypothetical protein